MYRKSVKRFKKRKFCNIEWFLISFWIVSIIKLGSNIQGKPTSYFFSVLMNYSWTKTLVQEQFAWNLSSCLTKIWISPTLQVGWSGLPKHQLMLDFIFPPNLSELPFLVIPMGWAAHMLVNLPSSVDARYFLETKIISLKSAFSWRNCTQM